MIEVTYVGDEEYGSVDPETGRPIQLRQGESCEVSERKAEQLRADFPQLFQFAGDKPKAPRRAKKSS